METPMKVACVAMLACALFATPAGANGEAFSAKDTRVLMRAYGECMVKRNAASATEALLALGRFRRFSLDYPSLANGECLDRFTGRLSVTRFTDDLYRFALADALFRQELAGAAAPDPAAAPPLLHQAPAEPRGVTGEAGDGATFRFRYGECVVRNDPGGAKALLLARPGTRDELDRIEAMRPALSACLPAKTTITVEKLVLRGVIAVNYVRLAPAAAPAHPVESL